VDEAGLSQSEEFCL